MQILTIFSDLARWLKFNGFWAQRVNFYRDLAQALEEKEQFGDYVDAELAIAVAPKTVDSSKAAGLRYLQALRDEGMVLLEDALPRVMPASDAMGLAVLRDTTDKPAALRFLADILEEEGQMIKVVRSALINPVIMLLGAFVMALVISYGIIPILEKVAPPEIWSGYPGLLRSVSGFVRSWGPVLAALIAAFTGWLFIWGLPNLTLSVRYSMESANRRARMLWSLTVYPVQPIFSVYRDMQSARMLASLATLLRLGRQFGDAVEDLANHATPWMRRHLLGMLEYLQLEPGDYIGAFSQGFLSPPMLTRLSTMLRRDSSSDITRALIEIGTVGQAQAREEVRLYSQKLNFWSIVISLSLVMFFLIGTVFSGISIGEANSPAAIMRRQQNKQHSSRQIQQQDVGKTLQLALLTPGNAVSAPTQFHSVFVDRPA